MYKITRQEQANSAAEEWKNQRAKLNIREHDFTMLIYRQLIALGETPNPVVV